MAVITAAQSQAAAAALRTIAGASGTDGTTLAELAAYAATTGVWTIPAYTAGNPVTALTVDTDAVKAAFRAPFAVTITAVKTSVSVAPTGATLLVDVHKNGTTILSTKTMIDAGEFSSVTATTPNVISVPAVAADDLLTVHVDQIGSSVAGSGLSVNIYWTRT